jgi:hypothetical protein
MYKEDRIFGIRDGKLLGQRVGERGCQDSDIMR